MAQPFLWTVGHKVLVHLSGTGTTGLCVPQSGHSRVAVRCTFVHRNMYMSTHTCTGVHTYVYMAHTSEVTVLYFTTGNNTLIAYTV